MGISRQFLLVCAVWCFWDQVHSIPSHTKIGSSSFRSSVATPPLRGGIGECGKSKKTEVDKLSIVNGHDAILGDWPWMVGFFFGSLKTPEPKFFCGGSLISKQWIMTAAHCVVTTWTGQVMGARSIFVRLGDLDIDDRVKDGASPLDALVDQIVSHPQFSMNPYVNDIALIRMKNPVHFTENIRPICLLSGPEYTANEYYNQKQPIIIGWGTSGEKKNLSSHLQETPINITAIGKCAQQYSDKPNIAVIDEKVICAGGSGKEDTCQGDSGGPLIFFNKTEARFYSGGITSVGYGCARENYSGVYTKVAQFIPWINEITGGSF